MTITLESPVEEKVVESNIETSFVETFKTENLDFSKIIKTAEDKGWENALVTGGNLVKELRDSSIQYNKISDFSDEHKNLLDFFANSLNIYLGLHPIANDFPTFSVSETFNILKYEKGQAYHSTHADYFPYGLTNLRHLSGVCFMSDVSEGGELVFPQQDLEIKPERGKLVIFPSGWTHAHHTMPVLSDDLRYVFQLWWSFV
tara:strand:- start:12 stop:617 length:606 start_codon:yes stop_codon:yes gene_type:complete